MQACATSWKHEPFKEGVPLLYQATFDSEQFAHLKAGLVPQQMEDKWFIYYEEPHLFLHRSWTGQPVYRLTLRQAADCAEVTEALWSRDLADTSELDSDYQARLIDFLVSNLLLRQGKRFPIPPALTGPKQGIYEHHISGTGYPPSKHQPKQN